MALFGYCLLLLDIYLRENMEITGLSILRIRYGASPSQVHIDSKVLSEF